MLERGRGTALPCGKSRRQPNKMGAKKSKKAKSHGTNVEATKSPPPAPPSGTLNRRRRVSVSAEVDTSKALRVKRVIPKSEEQLKDIEKAISGCFLFSSLDDAQRKDVIDSMEEKRYGPGSAVIQEGGPGDYFYITGSGELEVFIAGKNNDEPVRILKPGDTFGELALMYNSPRTATVKAVTECLVWALDRITFRDTIMEAGRQRRQKYEQFLSSVSILKRANLSSSDLAQLADAMEPAMFVDGHTVIKEGDADRSQFKFYIIEEGEARVYVLEKGEEVLMSRLGPGDYFGEKALVEKTPRTATVRAHGTLKCATLSIAGFERLMGPCGDILKTTYRNPADVRSSKVQPRGEA
ncbi:unnamed protein product [Ascophyllum nodosum]